MQHHPARDIRGEVDPQPRLSMHFIVLSASRSRADGCLTSCLVHKVSQKVHHMRIVPVVLILAGLICSSRASAAPTACELVSAADMSTVLGSAVGAVADDRGGQTKCTYETVGGDLGAPYAEVQLNWGDGVVGIKGAGAMEPQLGRAMGELAGLGDASTSVGPMISNPERRGSDHSGDLRRPRRHGCSQEHLQSA